MVCVEPCRNITPILPGHPENLLTLTDLALWLFTRCPVQSTVPLFSDASRFWTSRFRQSFFPLIFYHYLTKSTSLYFIQCLHGLNYNRVLVRNSGAATDRTVLKPPASMIVIPTKPTSPATKRTNHTFPQPPATTTASPTKPTNPPKRTKKPRTSKLELCIIIFLGLAWVLAIQISYDSIYHHERRHNKEHPHSTNQALESSNKPQLLRNSDAKQGPPKYPPQQSLKTNENSDKLQQNGSSNDKQKRRNVYQELVTPSYNKTAIHEMMSIAGLQYAPCLPPKHECSKGDTIRAYNSWNRSRYLCGQRIAPKSFVDIQEACHEGIRVFDEQSAVTTSDTHPLKLNTIHKDKRGRTSQPYGCTVPCEQGTKVAMLKKVVVDGTVFKFMHSMESAINYKGCK